ncbi:aprataxin-related [Anaeramoeba ignava]|uniref:Aprataxin-related n=1 Tax=Anaeramoeba ignava TaxID=1746090 RepID=A0A9Q0LA42_ANAIG|nr:aprataxin-related [Anaeramoeba ignava]
MNFVLNSNSNLNLINFKSSTKYLLSSLSSLFTKRYFVFRPKNILWKKMVNEEKLKEIEKKRMKNENFLKYSEEIKKFPKNWKRICPVCKKPNQSISYRCSLCGFQLEKEDIEKYDPNLFGKIANQKAEYDKNRLILYQDSEIVCLEDAFKISEIHFLVIPKTKIETVNQLKANHCGMVKKMYRIGFEIAVAYARSLNNETGKIYRKMDFHELSKRFVCGFNLPVSIDWLHLHASFPPFKLSNCFRYPRFNPIENVIFDLEHFQKVNPFILNFKENESELANPDYKMNIYWRDKIRDNQKDILEKIEKEKNKKF